MAVHGFLVTVAVWRLRGLNRRAWVPYHREVWRLRGLNHRAWLPFERGGLANKWLIAASSFRCDRAGLAFAKLYCI